MAKKCTLTCIKNLDKKCIDGVHLAHLICLTRSIDSIPLKIFEKTLDVFYLTPLPQKPIDSSKVHFQSLLCSCLKTNSQTFLMNIFDFLKTLQLMISLNVILRIRTHALVLKCMELRMCSIDFQPRTMIKGP